MRNLAVLIALAALFANPSLAQPPQAPPRAEDHLEPDGSILGGDFMANYDLMLRDVLHAAYEPDVSLRMVAKPSFIPEYAVGLRAGKTIGQRDFETGVTGAPPYRIFGLSPAASVWTYQSIAMLKSGQTRVVGENAQQLQKKEIEKAQASVPANPRDLKVAQCEAAIDDSLGNRIIEVWHKMLMRTRYSQQNMNGTDGATYDFSMFVRGLGDMSGHVWLPERNSSTGALVTLANEMYGICTKRKDASVANLEKLTAELEHRLN